jgi:osmotically-inducible protein OsmY
MFAEVAPDEDVTMQVKGGIVTLTGHASAAARHGAVRAAVESAWDVDGVVDIIDHTASAEQRRGDE